MRGSRREGPRGRVWRSLARGGAENDRWSTRYSTELRVDKTDDCNAAAQSRYGNELIRAQCSVDINWAWSPALASDPNWTGEIQAGFGDPAEQGNPDLGRGLGRWNGQTGGENEVVAMHVNSVSCACWALVTSPD